MIVRAVAKLRFASIPVRKMRLVSDTVKGLPVEKALNILNFTERVAARHIAKTLKSAAANALSLQGTDHLRPEALTVKNITVDEAPTAKRIRFQSMGRVFRIRKRYCHLTVEVTGVTDAPPIRSGAKSKAKPVAEVKGKSEKDVEATGKKQSAKGADKKKSTASGKMKAAGKNKDKEE